LVRVGLVRVNSVGAGSEPAPTAVIHEHMESADTSNNVIMQGSIEKLPSVRVGQVRADSVGAGSIGANSVGAGSEPAPTVEIRDYLEPAPTTEFRENLEPATMCSNPINQDGSNLPLSNWAGLVRVGQVRADSVGAGSEPAPTAATHDYPEPAPTFANIIKLDSSGIGSSLGMPW